MLQLSTNADNVALPAYTRRPHAAAAAAAIDRYLLPAGHTAANLQQGARQADRQTDGRTPYRYIDSAPSIGLNPAEVLIGRGKPSDPFANYLLIHSVARLYLREFVLAL